MLPMLPNAGSSNAAGLIGCSLVALACGSPAAVVEKIRAYVDAGCTTPILRFASWDQKGQLARAIADVMPAALALRLPV